MGLVPDGGSHGFLTRLGVAYGEQGGVVPAGKGESYVCGDPLIISFEFGISTNM